jgi:hypothetical protein
MLPTDPALHSHHGDSSMDRGCAYFASGAGLAALDTLTEQPGPRVSRLWPARQHGKHRMGDCLWTR